MNLIKALSIIKTALIIGPIIFLSVKLSEDTDLCLEPQLRYSLSIYLVLTVLVFIYCGRHFYRMFNYLDVRRFIHKEMELAYKLASYQHMYNARNFYEDEFDNCPISTTEELYLNQVRSLSKHLARKDRNEISLTELPCVLCLDLIDIEQDLSTSLFLPCKHVFHGPCLMDWLKIKMKCPTCKRSLRQTLFDEFMKQEPKPSSANQLQQA